MAGFQFCYKYLYNNLLNMFHNFDLHNLNQRATKYFKKFKGPAKSFGYWELKLLPGIRVIAEGLAQRPRPEPLTHLELHMFKVAQR